MAYVKQLQSDVTDLSLYNNKYANEHTISHATKDQFSGTEPRLNYGDTCFESQLNLGF